MSLKDKRKELKKKKKGIEVASRRVLSWVCGAKGLIAGSKKAEAVSGYKCFL